MDDDKRLCLLYTTMGMFNQNGTKTPSIADW